MFRKNVCKSTGLWKALTVGCIRFYQYLISPLSRPCCRYYPSCSQYCVEVITKFGVIRGGWLGLKRLLRCHPWGGNGVDLPPHKLKER